MSHHPPMNGRQPTMIDLLRVAGERDGIRARAEQLAAQVRTTTVSLGGKVDAAKAEADRLRGLLREAFDCLDHDAPRSLYERIAAELGIEDETASEPITMRVATPEEEAAAPDQAVRWADGRPVVIPPENHASADPLAVLRTVEWSSDDDGANCCPACREWQSHGEHEANCKLAKAIGAKRKMPKTKET